MKRLGVFATPEEIDKVKVAQSVSGIFLSGGILIGNPSREVHSIALAHGLPEIHGYYGMDTRTGEIIEGEE